MKQVTKAAPAKGKAATPPRTPWGDPDLQGTWFVTEDVPPGERWGGSPARPVKLWMRELKALRRLTRDGAAGAQAGQGQGEE